MEKKDVLWSNRQLSRTYSLFIINFMLLISAIALNYCHLNNNKILYVGIALDIVALIFFKPWKMIRHVRELYTCQKMLKEITGKKG